VSWEGERKRQQVEPGVAAVVVAAEVKSGEAGELAAGREAQGVVGVDGTKPVWIII
jgi:hypothetical protein